MKYLNLGCGNRYSKDWINVDFVSSGVDVQQYDLTRGIPFSDSSFNAVYHSHVLEHFTKDYALNFLKECYRVLKPGGIVRIVVPDLEGIAREYIANLEQAKLGNDGAKKNYDWIILEMYDQSVRSVSGGNMAKYWAQDKVDNEEYIINRFGCEYTHFQEILLNQRSADSAKTSKWNRYFQLSSYRNRLIQIITGEKQAAHYMRLGKFRSSGEIHQWMYDGYSLGKLLSEASFTKIVKQTAFKSNISNWKTYAFLDVEEGKVRKPDSLFMEAFK